MLFCMKQKNLFSDAKHWRGRAEATRLKAESIEDDTSRCRLLKVAEEYDKLARIAEGRQRSELDGQF
ncbi:hypothetical protein BSZ22_12860 [Bradyrhizobium canariense]|uniref:Uncharacterized protein n=1 Tax=Bradyrhizobium canariense TaxID=255045 RepID=A0A1X3H7A0_9BRAD|nr:hypothetical protein BSZ22_12860 [Bradyrhizobium canariense]OSI79606.1 hypothetical protein BSZ23_14550 [Bradyrhizobium canariense]OSI91290.1 hypothetical protein BSZ24_18345 [Bradyrhizobium canariense]OSI91914.1 hypothetical protein BSZ25_14195 [Bradyrhizobium canariense]OSJ05723.1 hypothetical protein BSZ16_11970 [Bradyrhizobium canariense]